MDLKEIMSVSGQGGLFKFVSQARNGIVVESFSDKKRSFVSAATKVSALEDIAVFTEKEEVMGLDTSRWLNADFLSSPLTIKDGCINLQQLKKKISISEKLIRETIE